MGAYKDDAVLIPGRGAVLIAPVGTEPPTADAINTWVADGAVGQLGAYSPLGYTSEDDLPKFNTDTDGGETKGAWENSALRMTKTKITDSISVIPIQWTEEPLTHRFGPGRVVGADGRFEMPQVYSSTDVAMLVLLIEGDGAVGIHYYKTSTSPDDSIELDPEKFAGMPVKYTVMSITGKPKGNVIAQWLKSTPVGG
ncbi:hypothetical protein [Corynebacterium heidelbergense]|uniref:Uncharacterized protein n=1 Tax=Corynebacterium heidelbergense TaxID=2055947 RepID=A0A364VCG2_9CORY|nr:hypothetical protein [Corynebacterium heidelbergense]RAV34256.1 hypothetical protein CWC39_04185 [Corynebacterium heidelbergense]WCZ36972.1 hypothetical protein CHEID_07195 [Corynebacterium heidelbergense]